MSQPDNKEKLRPGNIAVLGSTGSIGRQTLDVVRANPGKFRVLALAAQSNVELIVSQAKEFSPEVVALADEDAARETQALLGKQTVVRGGPVAIEEAACLAGVHTVVAGITGFACLQPVLSAIRNNKHIALANKECLVAGGPVVQKALRQSESALVPVDSEHSSVFQCLLGRGRGKELRKIVLTASGGPFLNVPKEELFRMPPERAVAHPRWKMGAKISVDSATLMNKGLEVMEAAALFNLPPEQIEVLVHPQSVVHGLAEYEDGAVVAVLFEPDMRVPIAFALSYLNTANPRTAPGSGSFSSGAPFLDLAAKAKLEFFAPDYDKFPALPLCYGALKTGGTMPAVLNAANEIAVFRYLSNELQFGEIFSLVKKVMSLHKTMHEVSLEDIVKADAWARECAANIVSKV